MNKFNYKKDYQNNCFNAKLSSLLDKKRSIMDIDCFLYKLGCKTKILFDHKKPSDSTTIASLKGYAMLANDDFHCFIVSNDVDASGNIINNATVIRQIKPLNDVKNNAEKSDYIKQTFHLTDDQQIVEFFQVETHERFKKNYILNEQNF